jgi:N-acetylglucosaminyldiphosphoundecaprenol N-acetyl-beta-D-mannosaminyltransferase
MNNTGFVDGIPINLSSNNQIYRLIKDWLAQGRCSRHIITLNSVMLVTALKYNPFKNIIKQADLVTVDGYGIEWALRKKGYHNIQRLTGVDLTRELLKISCQNDYSVYFLGGTLKVVSMLETLLPEKWPGLSICGIRDGYGHSLPPTALFNEIVEKQPRLLFVAKGSPDQEMYLAGILPYLNTTVGIGVGGTFEVLCGLKREAPQFIRNHGLEWCFRMLQEPRKLRLIPDLARFWYKYLR